MYVNRIDRLLVACRGEDREGSRISYTLVQQTALLDFQGWELVHCVSLPLAPDPSPHHRCRTQTRYLGRSCSRYLPLLHTWVLLGVLVQASQLGLQST